MRKNILLSGKHQALFITSYYHPYEEEWWWPHHDMEVLCIGRPFRVKGRLNAARMHKANHVSDQNILAWEVAQLGQLCSIFAKRMLKT